MLSLKAIIVGGLVATALLVAGCQSTGKGAAASGPATQAVMCSKCKVTYVKVPGQKPSAGVVGYRMMKQMECPECRTAAENFFATGKLERSCKICGDSMELCEGH